MLVARHPQISTSLLEIRDLEPNEFYLNTRSWYAEGHQRFSRVDRVNSDWIMCSKVPVAGSMNMPFLEQSDLIKDPVTVPNAVETAWCLTMYRAVRGIYLIPNLYVRTSSRHADGHCVCVGFYNAEGLSVCRSWDDRSYEIMGLSVGRQLPLTPEV